MALPKLLCATTIVGLSACGGTSTPVTTDLAPLIGVFGTTDVELVKDGTNLILKNGTNSVPLTREPTLDRGTFDGYLASSGQAVAVRSETDNSRATFTYADPALGAVHAVSFSRSQGTSLPTEGTATLSGDYVGILVYSTGQFYQNVVGDVTLNLLFGDTSTVSGVINNRTNLGTLTYADLIIPDTMITANGEFSTAGSGGSFAGNPVDGSQIDGVFAGNAGAEAVGAVKVTHNDTGALFTERGVFAAGH